MILYIYIIYIHMLSQPFLAIAVHITWGLGTQMCFGGRRYPYAYCPFSLLGLPVWV